mgnify:CR=1 FL=1
MRWKLITLGIGLTALLTTAALGMLAAAEKALEGSLKNG